MSRPINAHRRAVITAQRVLKDCEKRASASGFTLAALLNSAGVSPKNWAAWMAGQCVPRSASLEAVQKAVAIMEGM